MIEIGTVASSWNHTSSLLKYACITLNQTVSNETWESRSPVTLGSSLPFTKALGNLTSYVLLCFVEDVSKYESWMFQLAAQLVYSSLESYAS